MDDALRIPIEDTLDLHAFQPRDIPSVVEEYRQRRARRRACARCG